MSQQDQLNADVAAIQTALTGISSDVAGIQTEIAGLQAQVAAGGQLDLSALDALATQAASVKTAVDGLIPAAPAPAAQ